MKVTSRRDIQSLIDEIGLTYNIKDDGINVPFGADSDYGYNCLACISWNDENHVLSIHGMSAQNFSKDKHGELVLFCNQWNNDKMWPCAWVTVLDNGEPDVRCGAYIPKLEYDVSPEFMKNWLKFMVSLVWRFYVELGKEFK